MLTLVRHGHTSFNEDGKEKLRGWLSIPLNKDGIKESINTAKLIKQWKLPFDKFYSSPLQRAVQTANPISDEINKDFETKKELLDWNYGKLTGTPVEKSLQKIFHFIDNPDEKVPDGESFNSFLNRDIPFLKKLVEDDDNHLVVTHNRVTTLAHALSKHDGSKVDIKTMKSHGPIEPGGIMVISPDWNMEILHSPNGKTHV